MFRKNKQKGIIPAILALIIGLICIPALVLLLAIGGPWLHHIIAGLSGGGDQPGGNSNYGTGNCATAETLNGAAIPEGGKGKLVLEQHLATDAEYFSGGWPRGSRDQDERHYQLTNFSVNCAGCPKEGFTPAEGGGSVGQGTGEKPPVSAEPWIVNMRANFPRGTKMIITSTKTGKTVVAAGGYEYGPSSHEFIGGAQPEVLKALGILDGDRTVTIGFAQDQSLPYGPITCSSSDGASKYVGKTAYPIKLPVTVGNTLHYCTAYRADGCGRSGHRKFWRTDNKIGDAVDLISENDNTVYAVFDGIIEGSGGRNSSFKLRSSSNKNTFAVYGHSFASRSGSVRAGEAIGNYSSSVGHIHFEI